MEDAKFKRTLTLKNSIYLGISSMIGAGLFNNLAQPVVIDGIVYSHYFTSGVMGRPVSNARLLLQKKMMSCVQGHVQDRDIAFGRRADGSPVTGLFAGIFYQHDEDYLTPQTNGSWSGIWMFNEVDNGSFDEMPVSMNYLRRKYGES